MKKDQYHEDSFFINEDKMNKLNVRFYMDVTNINRLWYGNCSMSDINCYNLFNGMSIPFDFGDEE